MRRFYIDRWENLRNLGLHRCPSCVLSVDLWWFRVGLYRKESS